MRSDMHKVVVERPRHGRSWARSKLPPRSPYDQSPRYESMKASHTTRKWFSDLLGPLQRWLQSQVDRPWNDVYSEACAVIKPDSVVRAHIKTHLLEFVERNTFMHGGEVCFLEKSRLGGITPITEKRYGRASFFVHPETGLLSQIPRRPRKRKQDGRENSFRWLKNGLLLRKLHGCWFKCQVIEFPPIGYHWSDYPRTYDVCERREIPPTDAYEIYGRNVFCVAKRQMSRAELKECGLVNDPPRFDRISRLLANFRRALVFTTTAIEPDYAFPDRLDGCEQCAFPE